MKLYYTNSLVLAVFTHATIHLCAFWKSNIYLIAMPKGPTWPLLLYCFNWCVFWLVRILLGPKKKHKPRTWFNRLMIIVLLLCNCISTIFWKHAPTPLSCMSVLAGSCSNLWPEKCGCKWVPVQCCAREPPDDSKLCSWLPITGTKQQGDYWQLYLPNDSKAHKMSPC